MAPAPKWAELESMTWNELIKRHDLEADNTNVGLNHYFLELNRRVADRQTRDMLKLTRFVAALTVVNIALVAMEVFGGPS
jgi:hypothetical protein